MTTASELLRAVKADLGLTWVQLGRVFGVSSRVVYLWANGGYMSTANIVRLHELAATGELHSQYRSPELFVGALHDRQTA